MAWSRDNIIAILALFATCAPIAILVTTFLLRRKQRGSNTQVSADMERLAPSSNQQPGVWYREHIRRQPTLTIMVQIQKYIVEGAFFIRSIG
ncbi:hypothetical protein FB567DRAFT_541435 [Paraphoma chrysanthemicola]|uniref:Uncharacterized protein n=1 Tax=Paraphoma chrysanthemicola TaxID=798071 RepID=A0A8K0QRG0_9PLEO|nr:hypothetical protein FB567DRAFT_541435 [Paraphoma chrysanthemicola]